MRTLSTRHFDRGLNHWILPLSGAPEYNIVRTGLRWNTTRRTLFLHVLRSNRYTRRRGEMCFLALDAKPRTTSNDRAVDDLCARVRRGGRWLSRPHRNEKPSFSFFPPVFFFFSPFLLFSSLFVLARIFLLSPRGNQDDGWFSARRSVSCCCIFFFFFFCSVFVLRPFLPHSARRWDGIRRRGFVFPGSV